MPGVSDHETGSTSGDGSTNAATGSLRLTVVPLTSNDGPNVENKCSRSLFLKSERLQIIKNEYLCLQYKYYFNFNTSYDHF